MLVQVGTYVYLRGRPQMIGRVIEIITRDQYDYPSQVKVQWMRQGIQTENTLFLNLFEELIADHQKKINTLNGYLADFKQKFPEG